MAATIELERMTTDEKLRLLELVWEDLSKNPEAVPSPAWHGKILSERDQRIREGKSQLGEWRDAKRRIREQVE